MKAPGEWPDPVMDIERTTKAAQCAALLCGDLRELVRSPNLLLSDIAMQHLADAQNLKANLERLASNLKQMEVKS